MGDPGTSGEGGWGEGLARRAQLLMSVGLGMGMALEHAKSHLIHKCDLLSMETSA